MKKYRAYVTRTGISEEATFEFEADFTEEDLEGGADYDMAYGLLSEKANWTMVTTGEEEVWVEDVTEIE